MPTILILILVLLVATCVIAYWSDNLGKKLGKKRISLLGLRPRQTATFISMGSSVGIMLLTLVVLLGSSASLRNALTRYDQTKKENSRLIAANTQLRDVGHNLIRENETARKQAETARAAAEAALRQARQARGLTLSARHELKTARSELASARTSALLATRRASQADRQYRVASASLTTAQSSLKTAKSTLHSNESRLRIVSDRLTGVNNQLHGVQEQIRVKQKDLATVKLALRTSQRAVTATQKANLQIREIALEEIGKLTDALQRLKEEQKSLEDQRTVLMLEQRDLKAQNEARKKDLEAISQVAGELTTGNVEIPYNSVFADSILPAKSSRPNIVAAARSLLDVGRQNLAKLDLTMSLIGGLQIGQGNLDLSEDQLIDGLVEYISTMRGEVSIRLVAARDHAPGEREIRVRFVAVPIEMLFAKDSEIAKITVNSSVGDAQLFRKLLDLLNTGEANARRRGASPILTESEPNFWPSGTNERIFEALRRIQALGGDVEVHLVAANDLTTIGPMQIRFDVRKQDG